MNQKSNYYIGKHSSYLLQYHLVLVTKYRHKFIIDNLKDCLLKYTYEYFTAKNLNIITVNTDKDHIHIMFEAYPNLNLSNFIKSYKSSTSRILRNKFERFLSKYYWKPYFWSSSYFICTVSEKSLKLVEEYIKNQGMSRKKKTANSPRVRFKES